MNNKGKEISPECCAAVSDYLKKNYPMCKIYGAIDCGEYILFDYANKNATEEHLKNRLGGSLMRFDKNTEEISEYPVMYWMLSEDEGVKLDIGCFEES